MGTQLTVGRGGGNNRNFYNPNYVYELDADGERMKDDKGMAVPLRELSDGVSVPVLVDSVDETLVSIQDKRREDLNAEISNLVREYDVRNKDRPDEARLYPLIWRLINGDFWDTAVAERLLVPSHEDHVSTLCAVWSLASHKFEWHRNQVWKGLRGFSKRAPNPIPTYDQTVTTIRIWIVTPTDFSKSPEGGYPSEV